MEKSPIAPVVIVKTRSKVHFTPRPERTIEWLGGVNCSNLERVLGDIKSFMAKDHKDEVHLLINSYGGATGIAMSFYDAVTGWLKPRLVTIGSGDVDSSGIIIFLSGYKRFLTKNTTMLLHMAGRTFDGERRFTASDMKAMVQEDTLKDYQYACVIADATRGAYTPERILELMAKNTILTADEAVNMGLADRVLQ